MDDPAELSALLSGTSLGGCLVEPGDDDDCVLMVRDVPGDVLTSWRVARALVPQTGRWPVAVPESTAPIVCPDTVDEPAAPWPDRDHAWEVTAAELEHSVRPELLERARSELALPTTTARLDRWTYDTVLADWSGRGRLGHPSYVEHGLQHHPAQVDLALLPFSLSWQAGACIGYYGSYGWPEEHSVPGVLREWHARWGADLVANWDTMLELVVSRPPQDPEDCWTVAGQLLAVGRSLHVDQWQLALSLPQSTFWFLHDRP